MPSEMIYNAPRSRRTRSSRITAYLAVSGPIHFIHTEGIFIAQVGLDRTAQRNPTYADFSVFYFILVYRTLAVNGHRPCWIGMCLDIAAGPQSGPTILGYRLSSSCALQKIDDSLRNIAP